eukprot:7816223-Ditylum_brightwellii.AAC.1
MVAFELSWGSSLQRLRYLHHYNSRTPAWIETGALLLVQEAKEFAICKFCHWTIFHVDKSQLARLLMACSTSVAPS